MASQPKTILLRALLATTALSSAVGLHIEPAKAADECGVPVNGVVTCAASGSPYQGVSYTANGDLTVQLDDNVTATAVVIGGGGDKTVVGGSGAGITAAAKDSTGLDMRSSDGGALNLTLDNVSVSGESADGLWLETTGDVTVDLGTVTATGFMAYGGVIRSGGHASVQIDRVNASAWNGGGFAINAKTAEVNIDEVVIDAANSNGIGFAAQQSGTLNINTIVMNDGIYGAWGVTMSGGNVALNVDTISGGHGGGVYANANGVSVTAEAIDVDHWGVYAQSSTDLNIDVGRITTTTTGTNSAAAIIAYGKNVNIVVDEISTLGSGPALYAGGYDYGEGENTVRVKSGQISTQGTEATGIFIDGRAGAFASALVDSGSVTTTGEDAAGIHVEEVIEAVVSSQSVTTSGNGANGLSARDVEKLTLLSEAVTTTGQDAAGVMLAETDQVVLDITDITTTGDRSAGVAVEGAASLSGRIDNIRTEGDEAIGLHLAASDIDLEFGSIETFGNNATGIEALSEDGLVRLKGDSVITHGANARGVEVSSVMGGALILGSVHTYGDGSDGVVGLVGSGLTFPSPTTLGLLTLDIGQVRTEGVGALGVNLRNVLGEITGHVETIETLGYYSAGFRLSQDDGVTDVTLGSVTTHGEYSIGVRVGMDTGDVAVFADSVTTRGDYSHGVLFDMYDGSADLAFNTIVTEGEEAYGLAVQGSDGVAVLRANSIITSGLGAHGVALAGEGAIRMTAELGSVTTSGDNADAVTTSWDGLGNNSEAVTVKAGVLTTSGAHANGVYLYAQDLTLDIDRIVTTGAGSTGAFLTNHGGDEEVTTLRGRLGAIDTSGQAASGLIIQHSGRFDLEVVATHTRGDDSNGITIFAAGSSEAGGKLVAGSVLTEGDESVGVDLYTEYGGYDVGVQSIETRGEYSRGLQLRGGDSSSIQLGSVRTSGDHADGVYASVYGLDSDLVVAANDIRTTGVNAYGVRARAEADVTLNLGYVDATGSETDAVVGESGGALTLTASRRLGSASGVAADLAGETIDITLAATAVVEGGSAGLVLASQDGATIRNAGSISSANGFAIEAEAGKVTLDNSGLVTGRIAFSSADDVINNSGRFAAALTSNFGGGNDVFNNTGVLSLADVTATAPRTALFNNLERLNNAGVIDLTNGVAGDVFGVSGVVNGQTGGTVLLDLNLLGATPTADRIVAGGFEGISQVVLAVRGQAALGDTGIVIAESAIAQTGAEMRVRVADGGFVGYGVTFADGAYRLDAKLVVPAFEPTKVASGAQHQWTSGADVVSARFEQMRDEGGRAEGRGDQVWAQVFGGSNDIEAKRSFELMGERLDADLSHEVKSQGVQAGVDRAVPVDDGSLVFGMLAGAGKTELRFQNGDVTEYDGVGVGAYGHWFSGPLSIGVLAKLDTFKLDYDWAEANLKTRSDGFTVGARVDAAWRIAMGPTWHIEPQASLSWSDTALGRMKARDGAEVVFGDTRSVVGRIGVRAGAVMAVGDGLSFKPYAAVHALNEFDGDNASTLLLADEAVGVEDRAHGAWGRAVLGASLDAPSGLGGFIQAEGDFGQVEGFTARAGVKFSW